MTAKGRCLSKRSACDHITGFLLKIYFNTGDISSLKQKRCCFCWYDVVRGNPCHFSIDGIFLRNDSQTGKLIHRKIENLVYVATFLDVIWYSIVMRFLKCMTHLHQNPLQDFSQELKGRDCDNFK